MTTPVIQLDNILVTAAGRPILDVSQFAVMPGETISLVGPNGAGKSTLLHVAALLRRPDRGSVTILGEHATRANSATLRRALSLVFQDPLLFHVSVLENTAAGARFQGIGRAEAEQRALHWLDRFGVGHLARRSLRGLSGGEARRIALARAFVTDPTLVLLDEPFSALDAPTRETLLPALRAQLDESGKAAILVTHDLDEALIFADHLALIDSGHVIACGEARTLIARPPSRRAAALLGVENILTAHVSQRDGDMLLLSVAPSGPSVWVLSPAGENLPLAGPVTVTLPAGVARVLTPHETVPEGWNALPGRVARVSPQRSGTRLVVETPAPFVTLPPWHPSGHHWSAGDAVVLAFPVEAVHVIPGEE